MGTTPIYGIPYIEPTDALAVYPTQDKAQAEAVEAALDQTPGLGEFRLMATQAVGNATVTQMNLGTTFNYGGFVNDGAGGITVPTAGLYIVTCQVTWLAATGTAGVAMIYIRLGQSVQTRAAQPNLTAINQSMFLAKLVSIPAGGSINLAAYQNSGSGRNVDASNVQTFMTLCRL